MPVELSDDGETVTIRDEKMPLDPETAAWLSKQPNIGQAVKTALRTGAQRLTIDGTRVATTPQLLEIVRLAREAGLERQLDPALLDRLDPDGWHIVSARPQFLEGGETEELLDGRKAVRGEFKLGQPLPCLVMLKTRGREEAVEAMMGIPFMEFMVLPFAPSSRPITYDGETQR